MVPITAVWSNNCQCAGSLMISSSKEKVLCLVKDSSLMEITTWVSSIVGQSAWIIVLALLMRPQITTKLAVQFGAKEWISKKATILTAWMSIFLCQKKVNLPQMWAFPNSLNYLDFNPLWWQLWHASHNAHTCTCSAHRMVVTIICFCSYVVDMGCPICDWDCSSTCFVLVIQFHSKKMQRKR